MRQTQLVVLTEANAFRFLKDDRRLRGFVESSLARPDLTEIANMSMCILNALQ
jgi:hypothetical protein